MARSIAKLSARAVETARKPGRLSDGGNLYLNVQQSGAKSWLFIYRFGGKQREMGLGDLSKVGLSKAREKAKEARELIGAGKDPIEEKRRPAKPTFGEHADAYIKAKEAGWKNSKAKPAWVLTTQTYAAPLRSKPIDTITTADIVAILEPIWIAKHPTAHKVRQRLEQIFRSAKALGLFVGDNPASKERLSDLLPAVAPSQRHFAALAVEDVPEFIRLLRKRSGTSALALEFTILTGSRTFEAIAATWDEFDDLGWLVPAERMKGRKEHRVPLCGRAEEILAQLREFGQDQPYVFPGDKEGKHLSSAAMAELVKEMEADLKAHVTVHGMRSTFRDWASEHTNFSREVCEMALAHAIESKTEAAYRRGDLFMKRLDLMEAWGAYCAGASAIILPLAELVKAHRAKKAKG